MDVVALEQALEDVFDHAVIHHGFVDYMRDYELIVYATADPRTGILPVHLRYLFRYCVEARCVSTIAKSTWRDSLDERLIDHETGQDLDGYVWGVKWHGLYPGAAIVEDSPAAAAWAEEVGIDFHEVRIQTNAHDLTLVFSDLKVSELPSADPRVRHNEVTWILPDAASELWPVRARAGRRLAASAEIPEAARALEALLRDPQNTAVVQETAHALLDRQDARGLRLVLKALADSSDSHGQILYDALLSDPRWMDDNGPARLRTQLETLSADTEPAIREEAKRLLSTPNLQPRSDT
ncbi:hypothetical protein [Actinocorallia longicatena]|uniref:YxiG-like domain-containing protein n=1 Tax=Actinocorallia longicatena TaxID=111803 RepID=A0ABP6QDP8_9ACTN